MSRRIRFVAVFAVVIAAMGAAGCASTPSGAGPQAAPAPTEAAAQPSSPTPTVAAAQPSSPTPASQGANPADAGLPVQNGITGQLVTLPSGVQLSTTSVDLPDLASVHPEILGIGGGPGGNPVVMAAGNHVEEIRQEEVTLPIGKAYLAVVVRGQPSAANSDKKTHELWLIAVRKHPSRADMRLAYAIIGEVTGDEAKAREELLELGQHWRLPAE